MRCVVPCEKCRIYKHLSHVVKGNFVTSICNSIFGLCIVHFGYAIDHTRCMLVDFVDEKVWKKTHQLSRSSKSNKKNVEHMQLNAHIMHISTLQAMRANTICTQPNHNLLAIKNCIRNVMLEHEKYNKAICENVYQRKFDCKFDRNSLWHAK